MRKEFSRFGEIGDFYRPVLLHRHTLSAFAFVRYLHEADAHRALDMDGKELWEVELTVVLATHEVFFTHDTGFLTNYELNVPPPAVEEFDASLPDSHYDLKRKEELRGLDEYFTLRVDDLHPAVSKEQLEEIFSQFGELARVYFPVDLAHSCAPKGFAFVRYIKEKDAARAQQAMHGANLGIGRNLTVRRNCQRTYFSQDESPAPRPKRKPGVVVHIDP